MKKIAMFTMGTRGDVQPYIFLSKGLMRAGYDVTLGSHPCWRNLVEAGVLGIPTVNVTLQTEMIGEKLKKKKFGEKPIGEKECCSKAGYGKGLK